MTVHHLLDPLSEEDYEDADEESDVLASMEGLRLDTGTNEWGADDECDDEEGDEIEWQSDEDDERPR
ncbi:hypothetical protein K440DRAFT_618462 [Wilcoxina mikolae CBS 423.85]|nr:hypothetical protein K440DRAFT_618462 [Wilcoxina mikolae CBS 423.85]